MYKKYIKRPLDFICSLIAFLAFWWLFLIIAFLVRIKLGSPVLFKQSRIGKDEVPFFIYKFRSMTNTTGQDGKLLPDEARMTKFGHILRSSSLDEIPELWNILKGDMSIVGPRPWGAAYVPYYTKEEHHRLDVRPGLTGLAQVHGRTAASWDERLKFDIEYVRNITFLNDVKIILLTVKKVFTHADIVEAGSQGNFDDYRRKQVATKEV